MTRRAAKAKSSSVTWLLSCNAAWQLATRRAKVGMRSESMPKSCAVLHMASAWSSVQRTWGNDCFMPAKSSLGIWMRTDASALSGGRTVRDMSETSDGAMSFKSNHKPSRSCRAGFRAGSSSSDSSKAITPNWVGTVPTDCVSMACVMGATKALGKFSAMLMQTTPWSACCSKPDCRCNLPDCRVADKSMPPNKRSISI